MAFSHRKNGKRALTGILLGFALTGAAMTAVMPSPADAGSMVYRTSTTSSVVVRQRVTVIQSRPGFSVYQPGLVFGCRPSYSPFLFPPFVERRRCWIGPHPALVYPVRRCRPGIVIGIGLP